MLSEAKLYYYKARVYDPVLGRFLQTDPIGYEDDFNLYGYVGKDSLNRVDPFGLLACPPDEKNCVDDPSTEKPGAPPDGQPITEQQRKIDGVVVKARRDKKLGTVPIDFYLGFPHEQYASVSGDTVTPVPGHEGAQVQVH